MADAIGDAIAELLRLQQLAQNERRGHALTERLVDGVWRTGQGLMRAARG